jgi:hypothetical protein
MDGSVLIARAALIEFGGDAQLMTGRHTRRAALPGGVSLLTAGDYGENGSATSGYAQARLVASRLTLTPGLRADYWSLTSSASASPWLTAELTVGPRTRLRGGTGVHHQFAEFDQVFGLNAADTPLQPERAVHFDLGVEQTLFASTTLQVTGFSRRESDVLWPIGSEPRLAGNRIVDGFFDAAWTNALNGTSYGGEIVLRRDAATGRADRNRSGRTRTSATPCPYTGTIGCRAIQVSARSIATARIIQSLDTSPLPLVRPSILKRMRRRTTS